MGKTSKGRYICKVGFYDIYAKDAMRKKPGTVDKQETASTEYVIYHGKKMVEGKFKTKEDAINKVKS